MCNADAKTAFRPAASAIRLIVALLFTSLSSVIALAQFGTSLTNGHTPPGIAPGAPASSYALSGFDNINPYSGNLNFRLPLLKIGGRGKAGYTMMLPIEHQWRVERAGPSESPYWWASYNWWAFAKPRYGPGVFNVRNVAAFKVDCEAQIGTYMDWYSHSLTRLTFSTPDGTEYEFRDALTNGAVLIDNRCGVINNNRGRVWVTGDGTSATFITDHDIYDNQTAEGDVMPINPYVPPGTPLISGYLLMRDGTRYRIDSGRVSWISDTNGNRINFTYANSFGPVTEITDSLNRKILITYGNPDVITFKGFGGSNREIKIWYNLLSDQNSATRILRDDLTFPLKTTQQLFQGADWYQFAF